MRSFRFGFQSRADDLDSLLDSARRAEAAGFDVFHTFDHFGAHFSALAPLVAVAAVTRRLRLCPLVLNNDFHHPAHLAQELATIDVVTGGRLEVGIGAGHAFTEYAATGQPFDPPAVRKARLRESVEIITRLLAGEAVTYEGDHYHLRDAVIPGPAQGHVPLVIAVNGRAALAHAASHADTIGLTMLGRTLADGHRHEVRWQPERLDATVAWITSWGDVELNALVQAVVVTADRRAAAEELAAAVDGLTAEDALASPFVALGTHDQIADHLLACRRRWGISYFSVRDIDAFAPVIERLRRRP